MPIIKVPLRPSNEASFRCYKKSPEHSLLQAEQHQLSCWKGASPFCSPFWPPLDSFQHILLTLGAPELDTVLQVVSQTARVERGNHLSWPASCISWRRPGHVWLSWLQAHTAVSSWTSHQPTFPSLSTRAALKPFFTKSVFCIWDCPNPVSGPCTCPGWTSWGFHLPTFQPAQFSLDSLPSLQSVNHTTWLGDISKPAEGTLNPNC